MMADYQQAQEAKKTENKKSIPAPKAKTKPSSSVQKGVICPNCGAPNPEEALFCAECGFSLNQPLFCPNCGAKTSPGADICQVCKAWLLDNQCKFCYAELSPDAAFCPECGKPKEGIPCPHCGKLSIFDFCSGCGRPVTEEAVKTLELAKDDPDTKKIADAAKNITDIEAELAKLEESLISELELEPEPDSTPIAGPVKKPFFSDRKMAAIMKTDQNREASVQRQVEEEKKKEEEARRRDEEQRKKAEEARRQKEEQRKRTEEERRRLEEKVRIENERQRKMAIAIAIEYSKKTFKTHQEARCWHNAHRHPDAVGWLCNYTGTVHLYPEGPNECGEPALGGCDYFGEIVRQTDDRWDRWIPKV
jgi:ribosomal protein L40E